MKENSGTDFEAREFLKPRSTRLYPKPMGPDVFGNLEIFLGFRKVI